MEELIPTKEQALSVDDLLSIQERETIRLLLIYGVEKLGDEEGTNLSDYLLSETKGIDFQTPLYQKILAEFRQTLAKQQVPGIEFFTSHPDEEMKKEVIDLITPRHEISTHWHERFQIFITTESDDLASTAFKNVLRLKRRLVKKMLEEAKSKIKEGEESGVEMEKIQELLQVFMELKRVQFEIDRELGIVIG